MQHNGSRPWWQRRHDRNMHRRRKSHLSQAQIKPPSWQRKQRRPARGSERRGPLCFSWHSGTSWRWDHGTDWALATSPPTWSYPGLPAPLVLGMRSSLHCLQERFRSGEDNKRSLDEAQLEGLCTKAIFWPWPIFVYLHFFNENNMSFTVLRKKNPIRNCK